MNIPEHLAQSHMLTAFDCGVAELNEWLSDPAITNQVSGASRTYVTQEKGRVLGYYRL